MNQQYIMRLLTGVASLGIALGAATAQATPESDRQEFIKLYTTKYPNVKLEDYVYGALAFDADSKAQYDAIMEFPPFESQIESGRKMWETPFKNGKKYSDCLPNGGKQIAGNYPMFDDAKDKVVTLQDAINDCRTANGEEAYKVSDMKTMGTLTAYMRTLSDGMLMNIKVEGPKPGPRSRPDRPASPPTRDPALRGGLARSARRRPLGGARARRLLEGPLSPAPEQDRGAIAFGEKLLTILAEGRFQATYKYAVLLALMDLCLEHSTVSGAAPRSIGTAQLARKSIQLFFPHPRSSAGMRRAC